MTEIRHQPVAPTRTQWLAAGSDIDAHRHEDHQIVYAARGVLAVTTGAGTWIAPANRAIWIPAGTVHAHRAHGTLELRLLGLPPAENPLGLDAPAVLTVNPLLRELIRACTDTPTTAVRSAGACGPCCWTSWRPHRSSRSSCPPPPTSASPGSATSCAPTRRTGAPWTP